MEDPVALGTRRGRGVLAATVLGSGMAFLDSTVVNVALPSIGADLGAGVGGLQWVLTGYLVTLASLILLGGSLGDHLGRRRTFLAGVTGFAGASVLCALAPNVPLLVAARALQGAAGALLAPGSLAIIEASFRAEQRPAAIGAWSGLAGVSTAVGPLVGGWLVDAASWRWIFLLNLPLAAVVVAVAVRFVPESRDPDPEPFDLAGAGLAAAGLAALTWSLIAAGERGASDPAVLTGFAAAATLLAAFALRERRSAHPMLPPAILTVRQFTAANAVTFAVYAALGATFFLLVIQLQQVLGYSALEAGLASLPITVLMLALSSPAGGLAQRIGPRLPMTVGPLVTAAGFLVMGRIGAGDGYVGGVLPAVVLVGLGLSATVAPLTATALGAVGDRHAGLASGINNATARTAQLAAVATIPVVAGLTGQAYEDPAVFSRGFTTAMGITAGLAVLGAGAAAAGIRNPAPGPDDGRPARRHEGFHCDFDGPALRRCPRAAPSR